MSVVPVATGPDPGEYNDLVQDHFHHPRNAGDLPPGPGVRMAQAGNREAGAMVSLSVRIEGASVAAVRFRAFGCPHFLAAVSLATERLVGLPVASLVAWSARDIGRDLDVPVEKRGRLLILEDVVRAAMQ
jgi:nitrogen fixation NifU-like protein